MSAQVFAKGILMIEVRANWKSLVVFAAVSLSGCTTGPISNTVPAASSNIDAINLKTASLSKEQLDTCMSQKFDRLRALTPCLTADITFTQLANNQKINSQDRELFIQASTKLDEFGKQITQAYRDAGVDGASKIADARSWAHAQSLQNRLALVNREITWGEYLKQRMNIEAAMLRRAQ